MSKKLAITRTVNAIVPIVLRSSVVRMSRPTRDILNKARLGLSCGLTERFGVENRRPGPGAGAQSLGFRH